MVAVQVAHFARVVLWQKAIAEVSKAIATAKIPLTPNSGFCWLHTIHRGLASGYSTTKQIIGVLITSLAALLKLIVN